MCLLVLIGCASYHKLKNQASFAEAATLVPAGLAGIGQVQEYWRPRLFSAPNDDFSQNQNPDGGLQKKTVTLKLLVSDFECHLQPVQDWASHLHDQITLSHTGVTADQNHIHQSCNTDKDTVLMQKRQLIR